MQFQVPQFIDVSPKIVGPLTLRQFVYIAGAGIPAFILFFALQFWLWIIVAIVLFGAAIGLAFVKVNGQELIVILSSAFSYFWKPRFYLWQRSAEPVQKFALPKLPKFKLTETPARTPLKDLSLKLTTTTHPIERRETPKGFLTFFKVSRNSLELLHKTTGEKTVAKRVDYR